MTLRDFLDAGDWLLVEDALRIPGITLERAVELVGDSFRAIGAEPVVEERQVPVAAKNTAAMEQLQVLMAQVKR